MFALETLALADKLKLMEPRWTGLRDPAGKLTSPAWHADALDAAQQAHAAGQAPFIDWAQAKRQLRGE